MVRLPLQIQQLNPCQGPRPLYRLDARLSSLHSNDDRRHDATRTGDGGPVNNWLHSLFSQVDVYLNGTLVTPSTNTYAYRAYTETLLRYGTYAKAKQLTVHLWHKDTDTHVDAAEIGDGAAANGGFVARRANIVRSRVVEMMGRLHVDLFLRINS